MSAAAWNTDYGMAWRPEGTETITNVQRLFSLDGRAILRVWAQHPDTSIDAQPGIEIHVSPKGRSIRVYDRKADAWLVPVVGDDDAS